MFKCLRVVGLSLAILVGTFSTYSCQKQDVVEEMGTIKQQQEAHEALIAAMAKDPIVKDYIVEEFRYPLEFNAWYAGLTSAQQQEYYQSVDNATDANTPIPIGSHTNGQLEAMYSANESKFDAVKTKYPAFANLDDESKDYVLNHITINLH